MNNVELVFDFVELFKKYNDDVIIKININSI